VLATGATVDGIVSVISGGGVALFSDDGIVGFSVICNVGSVISVCTEDILIWIVCSDGLFGIWNVDSDGIYSGVDGV
jgi:hypothetical protein